MNINLFYTYNIQQRMDVLNRRGEFIMRIEQYKFYVSLYILDEQFIEVFFSKDENKIVEVEILEPNNERFELYATFINLADLF